MKFPPIINSLLDTDLYKFTMLQVILHQFPATHSVYHFHCRNWHNLPISLGELIDEVEEQIGYLCHLRFTADELDYLRGLRFIKSDFVDYLEFFQLKERLIKLSVDDNHCLNIAVEGPMIQAMFFEIFILAIVSEVYTRHMGWFEDTQEGERRLQEKIVLLKTYDRMQDKNTSFHISDFGTRRRCSFKWQKCEKRCFYLASDHKFLNARQKN